MTDSQSQSEKLQGYIALSQLSYNDAVQFLLQKYGPAKDDYFREASYQRFLNGEIKNPTKGKYSRVSEGLYAHHIAEIEHLNMANHDFIKEFNYPFELQKKEGLVYCDLIEHLILHAIIVHNTNGGFGIGGYAEFILPMVKDWYIDGNLPKPTWMQAPYQHAFLTADETQQLIDILNKTLVGEAIKDFEQLIAESEQIDERDTLQEWRDRVATRLAQVPSYYFQFSVILDGVWSSPKVTREAEAMARYCDTTYTVNTDEEFEEVFQKRFGKFFTSGVNLELSRQRKAAEQQRLQEAISKEQQLIKRQDSQTLSAIDSHAILSQFGFNGSTPRNRILEEIYSRKTFAIYPNFKTFKSSRINLTKDRLLDELAVLLTEESSHSPQQ